MTRYFVITLHCKGLAIDAVYTSNLCNIAINCKLYIRKMEIINSTLTTETVLQHVIFTLCLMRIQILRGCKNGKTCFKSNRKIHTESISI